MIRTYLLIVVLGALGGALAKAGTFVGLLDMEASTTAFLVAVIAAAVQLVAAYARKLERDDFMAQFVFDEPEDRGLPSTYNADGELGPDDD